MTTKTNLSLRERIVEIQQQAINMAIGYLTRDKAVVALACLNQAKKKINKLLGEKDGE